MPAQTLTVVALVLVLRRLGVPVVALRVVLGLAVVALVLVRWLRVLHPRDLRRLSVAIAALVLVRRLGVVLGLACAQYVVNCQRELAGHCAYPLAHWCLHNSAGCMYMLSVVTLQLRCARCSRETSPWQQQGGT